MPNPNPKKNLDKKKLELKRDKCWHRGHFTSAVLAS